MSQRQQTLVVDALNFLDFFFPRFGKTKDPWRVLATGLRRARGFLEASHEADLDVKFVVDSGWGSTEAGAKWRSRRVREVRKEDRTKFVGIDTLLTDLLRASGAEVYTPEGLDADDVVALLAHNAGSDSLILSADRDMFRYDLANVQERVKASFYVEEVLRGSAPVWRLVLLNSDNPRRKQGVSARSIASLEETMLWEPEQWLLRRSKLADKENHSYVRGTSDSFVKKYGNLQGHLAPLRHAVYKWTGRTSAVEELYPEWDKSVGDVTWVKVSAVPSDEGLPEEVRSVRAQGPVELGRAALRWLEARDPATADPVDASNMERGFARAILVAELMCCIDGEQELLEMLTSVTGHSVCESSARAAWPPREYMVKTHNVGRTDRKSVV